MKGVIITSLFLVAILMGLLFSVYKVIKKLKELKQTLRYEKDLLNEIFLQKENEVELVKNIQDQSVQIQQEYEDMTTKIAESQRLLDSYEQTYQAMEETQRVKLQLSEKETLDKLKEEHERVVEKLAEEKEEAEDLIKGLNEELKDYQTKRSAIIEGLKREKESRDKQDYYKILLTKEDIEDINYLKEFLNKIHKREVIAEVIYKVYIQEPAREMIDRVVGKGKISGIYRITNTQTEECYIGKGTDVRSRLLQHIKGTLGLQSIADQKIHREMADTGIQNWTFELLDQCDKTELTDREKFYIRLYKSNEYGFNQRIG